MARQIINVGTSPNDGTGDPIRTGGIKINDQTLELYRSVRFATGTVDAITDPMTPGKLFGLDPSTGQPRVVDFPSVTVGVGAEFTTYAALQAATITGAGSSVMTVRLTGRTINGDFGGYLLAIYSASAPTHSGYLQSADGAYWIFNPSIVLPGMAATPELAATMAFGMNKPMMWMGATNDGVAYLDINITTGAAADTPRARHAYLMQVIDWRKTCLVGANKRLVIRLKGDGLHTVAAYASNPDSVVPVNYWTAGTAGILDIWAESYTDYAISSITYSARGTNDYSVNPAIVRGPNGYQVTVVLASALPSYVVPGYALGLRNISGDNDAEALTGACTLETISVDRLTITFTVINPRTADLVSPTTVYTTSPYTYNGMLASRVVVPNVCIGWDTDYTVSATKNITGVTTFSNKTITGMTNALPCVVTSVAHGFSNGYIVTITLSAAGGMLDTDDVSGVNGRSFFVTNATADTFELYDLNGDPYDTTALTPYVSGGTVRRPVRLTVVAHGYSNGDLIRIASVGGMTELNNRQYLVGTVLTDDFSISDLNGAGIDNTGYGAYTSGGTTAKVVEAWTGANYEAYFNVVNGGQMQTRYLGFSYIGYRGSIMDQDAFISVNPGSLVDINFHSVIAGAGDKCLRGFANSDTYVNTACIGGWAQEGVSPQGGAKAEIVRSCVGGLVRYPVSAGDGSNVFITGCIMTSGVIGFNLTETATGAIAASKIAASVRGIYASGGNCRAATTVLINRCTTGMDAIAGGMITRTPRDGARIVSGIMTTVAGLACASTTPAGAFTYLVQDSIGSATSSKGGGRWIASTAGDQGAGTVTNLRFATGATPIDMDTATGTVSAGAVTINKQVCEVTTTSLTTAAGTTATFTLNNSFVTTTTKYIITRVGGTSTTGTPAFRISTRSAGSCVVSIDNKHATDAFNGTFILDIFVFSA